MSDRFKVVVLLIATAVGVASALDSGIVAAAPWVVLDLIR